MFNQLLAFEIVVKSGELPVVGACSTWCKQNSWRIPTVPIPTSKHPKLFCLQTIKHPAWLGANANANTTQQKCSPNFCVVILITDNSQSQCLNTVFFRQQIHGRKLTYPPVSSASLGGFPSARRTHTNTQIHRDLSTFRRILMRSSVRKLPCVSQNAVLIWHFGDICFYHLLWQMWFHRCVLSMVLLETVRDQ